jgi:hypothetical protein
MKIKSGEYLRNAMLGAVERLGHSSLLISRALGGDLCSITSSFYLYQPRSNFHDEESNLEKEALFQQFFSSLLSKPDAVML